MSAWLFDLGNTRLKCAPLGADGRAGEAVALPHREEDVAAALAQLLPERIDVAYVASVAQPTLRVAVLDALTARCRRISLARTQIALRCGADRLCRPAQARRRPLPGACWPHMSVSADAALVCGVGTALTIDLIDADGRHLGGRIAPSPTLMREVLHERAPQLPESGGDYIDFAADTEDALASGCDGAALALIERSLEAARQRLGPDAATDPARRRCRCVGRRTCANATLVATLVLEGLAQWASVETG